MKNISIDNNSPIFLEAFTYYKENGMMSAAYLQRKYKINFEDANNLSQRIKDYDTGKRMNTFESETVMAAFNKGIAYANVRIALSQLKNIKEFISQKEGEFGLIVECLETASTHLNDNESF